MALQESSTGIMLYGKGSLPLFDDEVAVTVVGTRDCTPYGVRAASQLGYELARQGALLVSGMAKGIDGEALKGALRAGGFTAAVLGGGADVVYPAANRRLYEDIAATGVILSEYPPGTEPKGDHFPVRNRHRVGGELKKYYERKVAEGKNKMSVINALRAKIVARMFAVIKRNEKYKPILS